MDKPRVLIVDDEKVIQQLFQRALEKFNYLIQTADNGQQALQKIKKTIFDFLIVDLKMSGMSGIDVLKEVKANWPDTEVIVITGYPTIEAAVEAMKMGAFDFICKPFDMDMMHSRIREGLERKNNQLNLKKKEG